MSAAWTQSSNTALSLIPRRTQADGQVLAAESELDQSLVQPFHPKFTYPIFGDDETVFGYKGLKISIELASGTLHQFLKISYDSKITSKSQPADDIEAKLKPLLAPDYTTSPETFQAQLKASSSSFKPFGTLMSSYTRPSELAKKREKLKKRKYRDPDEEDDEATCAEQSKVDGDDVVEYEIYKASWKDEGFKEYHQRMRFFIILYIEGGQYIDDDDDRWEVAVLYEKRVRLPSSPTDPTSYTYHFVGYTSLYPFLHYPDKTRLRLSQFFILPPYQHQGHGQNLYQTLYASVAARPDVAELTVEDPSEEFEDLRDVCDLRMMVRDIQASSAADGKGKGRETDHMEWKGKLEVGPEGADKLWLEAKRRELKIAPRQFSRLYEMLLLYKLEAPSKKATDAEFRSYRLFLKERLYRFNYEQLQQIEPEERKEKLEITYQNLMENYRDLLERADLDF